MSDLTTDVIVLRARETDALSRMLAWSVVVHAVAVAVFVLGPGRDDTPPPTRQVMSISLGGAPGPRTGGLTQMGGRTVQAVAPPNQAPRPAPPAAASRAAAPAARPSPAPARREARAVPEARRDVPVTGAEPAVGSTRTDTRVRGQGFGLSSAGGAAGGPVQLDVANFCCPDYLEQMLARIRGNWQQNVGAAGMTVMKFTVLRDGTLQAVQVERSSGLIALDSSADRAIRLTARLAPLPAQFPNPSLTVHMRFEYGQ